MVLSLEMSLFDLVSWDDGHRPGKTTAGTQMAINKDKQSSSFLSVFDNLMSEVWLDRIYEYSMNRNRKPWGVYVLTQTEVLNTAEIDVELCAAPKGSYSDSARLVKPDSPPS